MLKINWKNSGQRNRLLSLPAEVLMSSPLFLLLLLLLIRVV